MNFPLTSRSTITCSSRSIPLPGSGVDMEPTPEKLDALETPHSWILQQKGALRGVPQDGRWPPSQKPKIRMMFLWPDGGEPILVNNLVRMSQGKMMGVDFNKDKTWVGASIALHQVA